MGSSVLPDPRNNPDGHHAWERLGQRCNYELDSSGEDVGRCRSLVVFRSVKAGRRQVCSTCFFFHCILSLSLGILIIFAWRIIAKSTLHLILPPTFRFFARAVSLPNRRFYTPATQYNVMPSEFSQAGGGLGGLRPIPSVIDLPSTGGVGVEVGGIGSGNGSGLDTVGGVRGLSAIKSRNASGRSSETQDDFDYVNEKNEDAELRGSRYEKANDVKHYDADVLTKAIVYAGIGMLATEVIPILFDLLGWGVQSGP